ncbi:type II secretion system protein [Pseudoalteromonas lipolytica]|uniref:Prepilin-type N-terminal cleavage/methylation domain-containing protein n=1 Tax=Pseudoalteromonas lipolytica TaxID=570156 RepID=A0ABY1GJT6_9GAMM|nr:prepilin-type N-terminal cleavage/methylation domain-containing protein [Pseudoalteromonas lipolytica]MBE0349617.1 hypothetical protein [Pseudoalteromonas lipolytica LMEB 39]SFT78102.1 prepilin-type N-terminal cleavage/methylation domain-containing protein [Pseudoalteromonas lipolytica]
MFSGKGSKSQKAFTLIEVLIAMVIFSLVMSLSVMAYRFSLLQLGDSDDAGSLEELTIIKLVNNQVRTMKPFFVSYNNELKPFFIGTEKEIMFITEQPILINEPMAIAKLFIIDKTLKYCEFAYGSFSLENIPRSTVCEKSIHYTAREVSKFSYFGWKDNLELDNYYSQYLNINVKPKPNWYSNFNGETRKVMPLFIKVILQDQSNIMLKIPQTTSFQQGVTSGFQG